MKKITCTLLALVLLLSCIFLLAACGEEQTEQSSVSEQAESSVQAESSEQVESSELQESSEESKYELPDGYQLYDNGYISFAYPSDWTITDGVTVILMGTQSTNNITVAYEAKTDMYENWTHDEYVAFFEEVYASMNAPISNTKIEQIKKGDMHITVLALDTVVNGIAMTQTAYVVTTSNRTYSVTVTEVVSDPELKTNVFESLTTLK